MNIWEEMMESIIILVGAMVVPLVHPKLDLVIIQNQRHFMECNEVSLNQTLGSVTHQTSHEHISDRRALTTS